MARRTCIVCGDVIFQGSRCPAHTYPTGTSRPGSRRYRSEVLMRDNHTCQNCGRFGIHVDHIKPLRDGGTDELSNLRVLCQSCNLSKGATVG